MTQISGSLICVTEKPAAVSEVLVHAPRLRTTSNAVVTTEPDRYPVTGGQVTFPCAPGPAVLVLISSGMPEATVLPIVVADAASMSLQDAVVAAQLVDTATASQLEQLAAEAMRAVEAASAASASATAAQQSETNAKSSASSAAEAASEATSAASSASLSKMDADHSAANAAASATNAKNSETNAAASATNAKNSETNAASSASTASDKANAAAQSASNAAASAQESAASASAAQQSETNAKNSETNAAASATNAKNSETNAAASATNAKNSETNAAASATNAKNSETNAKISETNAKTSETNAASSASSAATDAQIASEAADRVGTAEQVGAWAQQAESSASSAAASAAEAANDLARKINRGDVQASDIVAGAVVAGKLAAGAVGTDNLQAGSVTSKEIAAGTITASNMVAGTLTAASGIIADAAIGSAQIIDGSIGTAKIADAAITDAKIANLDAGKITSGYVDAARISAGSITTDKLLVASTSDLCPNPFFDPSGPLLGKPHDAVPPSGGHSRLLDLRNHVMPDSGKITVQSGESYRITFEGLRIFGTLMLNGGLDVGGTGTGITGWFGLSASVDDGPCNANPDWHLYHIDYTVPTFPNGTVTYGRPYLQLYQDYSGGDTSWLVGALHVYRRSDASLIVDGSISPNKLAASEATMSMWGATWIFTKVGRTVFVSTNGTNIDTRQWWEFTIPDGYRPKHELRLPFGEGPASCKIIPNGTLTALADYFHPVSFSYLAA